MRKPIITGPLLIAFIVSGSVLAIAQESKGTAQPAAATKLTRNPMAIAGGAIMTPKSSVPSTTNGTTIKTIQANTNTKLYVPTGWKPDQVAPPRPDELPPFPGYAWETPASLACVYSLKTPVAGCNPNTVTKDPTGGSNAIAIVDAYDDPWAGPDLAYFSAQFGLPFSPGQFQVVYQDGPGLPPAIDETGGWEIEESLDIEYAHAMAPNATIYLVETDSNYFSDLFTGVQIAGNLISCGSPTTCPSGSKGKGEVSMSWGGSEFPEETSYDSYFTTPGVVYVAAAGDSPGTIYPCVSPNVVCAGGTTIRRNPFTGNFIEERSWEDTGGGVSFYEPTPTYQSAISGMLGGGRGVPDVSLDSNPITGAWVWDSNYFEELGGGWFIVGGTSVAAPNWAGIVNTAGKFYANSGLELSEIYSRGGIAGDYNDIKLGDCGPYTGYLATTGWDPCTGVGSPKFYYGK